jgi:hypothetical protein
MTLLDSRVHLRFSVNVGLDLQRAHMNVRAATAN